MQMVFALANSLSQCPSVAVWLLGCSGRLLGDYFQLLRVKP